MTKSKLLCVFTTVLITPWSVFAAEQRPKAPCVQALATSGTEPYLVDKVQINWATGTVKLGNPIENSSEQLKTPFDAPGTKIGYAAVLRDAKGRPERIRSLVRANIDKYHNQTYVFEIVLNPEDGRIRAMFSPAEREVGGIIRLSFMDKSVTYDDLLVRGRCLFWNDKSCQDFQWYNGQTVGAQDALTIIPVYKDGRAIRYDFNGRVEDPARKQLEYGRQFSITVSQNSSGVLITSNDQRYNEAMAFGEVAIGAKKNIEKMQEGSIEGELLLIHDDLTEEKFMALLKKAQKKMGLSVEEAVSQAERLITAIDLEDLEPFIGETLKNPFSVRDEILENATILKWISKKYSEKSSATEHRMMTAFSDFASGLQVAGTLLGDNGAKLNTEIAEILKTRKESRSIQFPAKDPKSFKLIHKTTFVDLGAVLEGIKEFRFQGEVRPGVFSLLVTATSKLYRLDGSAQAESTPEKMEVHLKLQSGLLIVAKDQPESNFTEKLEKIAPQLSPKNLTETKVYDPYVFNPADLMFGVFQTFDDVLFYNALQSFFEKGRERATIDLLQNRHRTQDYSPMTSTPEVKDVDPSLLPLSLDDLADFWLGNWTPKSQRIAYWIKGDDEKRYERSVKNKDTTEWNELLGRFFPELETMTGLSKRQIVNKLKMSRGNITHQLSPTSVLLSQTEQYMLFSPNALHVPVGVLQRLNYSRNDWALARAEVLAQEPLPAETLAALQMTPIEFGYTYLMGEFLGVINDKSLFPMHKTDYHSGEQSFVDLFISRDQQKKMSFQQIRTEIRRQIAKAYPKLAADMGKLESRGDVIAVESSLEKALGRAQSHRPIFGTAGKFLTHYVKPNMKEAPL